MHQIIIVGAVILVGILAILFFMVWLLWFRSSKDSVWPQITKCNICDKQVYVWQLHERRNMDISISGDIFLGNISGSAIVHKKCEGSPKSKVTVNRG